MAVTHEPSTAHTDAAQNQPPLEPPARELSPFRVAVLLVVLAGIAFGAWQLITRSAAAADARSTAAPVYAPYVDVTLTPVYQFQLPSEDPVSSAYLGFIVSDASSPCTPSWGGYYSLTQADQSLDLGARIAQLQKQGGSAMISFGGRDNNELAVACTDTARLTQAYLAPIQRYGVKAVDFDLEGAALGNTAANARRAAAVAAIQRQLAASPQIFSAFGSRFPRQLRASRRRESQPSRRCSAHMCDSPASMSWRWTSEPAAAHPATCSRAVRGTLYAAHAQVQALWRTAGLKSTSGAAWEHLGVDRHARGQRRHRRALHDRRRAAAAGVRQPRGHPPRVGVVAEP